MFTLPSFLSSGLADDYYRSVVGCQEEPQVEQLWELHEPQEEPCELENPSSLL
jgi:hypothetical protein